MSDYAERLAVANNGVKFTSVRGKQYAEVNQRILAFWSLFPNGRIITEKRDDGNRCDFLCKVYRDAGDEEPTVTGHAYEERKGQVNSTSYVENCETSAIGRALGLLGIGATNAIASADEVLNAIAQQEASQAPRKPANQKGARNTRQQGKAPQKAPQGRKQVFARIAELKMRCIENGIKEEGINSWYAANIGDVPMNRLSDEQIARVVDYLETMVRDSEDGHLKEGGNDVDQ